jgi:hypothetical protein
MRLLHLLAAFVAAACFGVMAAGAFGALTPGDTVGGIDYDCEAPSPNAPAPPQLPASLQPGIPLPAEIVSRPRPCPSGMIAIPASQSAESKTQPPYTHLMLGWPICEESFGACYNYSGMEWLPTGKPPEGELSDGTYMQGGRADLSQQIPSLGPSYHSLAELLLGAFNPFSGAFQDSLEMGWTVDATGVNGSDHVNPHLFVYFTNADYAPGSGGYNCCGFTFDYNPYVYDGIQVPGTGVVAAFEIYHSGEAWWFYYDGQEFAHIADSYFYGNFAHGADNLQAYGETAGPDSSDCTQMGNGLPAKEPEAATIENFLAVHSGNYYVEDAKSLRGYFASTAGGYSIANVSPTAVRYGGKGKKC